MAGPRRTRVDRIGPALHPTWRFFWGLGLLTCLVFAGGWQARGLLMALGAVLALASGKRVNFWYFGFLIFSVTAFNALLPSGRVWLTLGPWALTEGAFLQGLGKGFTFAGLVFFSLASISRDLRLPGRFGALWGQTFSYYEQLMDQRGALKPRALLLSIDRLLERLYPTRPGPVAEARAADRVEPRPTTLRGWVLAGMTLAGSAALSVLWR